MSAGIDYSMGLANRDSVTGIHYGVIHQNAVNPEDISEIYDNGTDLRWEQAKKELQEQLSAAIMGVLEETSISKRRAQEIADDTAESIVDDEAGEMIQFDESGPMLYEEDGYVIQTSDGGDLFVIKSPYYTHCRFCSPCAPGAGHLQNYQKDGIVTYCLGADWFDDEHAPLPYPIYSAETDELIQDHRTGDDE